MLKQKGLIEKYHSEEEEEFQENIDEAYILSPKDWVQAATSSLVDV